MTRLFLRARHWQIFIAIAAGPLLAQFLPVFISDNYIAPATNYDPTGDVTVPLPDFPGFLVEYGWVIALFGFLLLLSALVTWLWVWSVGTGLHHRLPAGTRGLNLRTFKIVMIVPWLLSILGGFITYRFVATALADGFGDPDPSAIISFVLGIFGIGLIFLAAAVYTWYFIGKTIRSVELGQPARGSQYVGYSLLVYVLIIGIFILQPTINRIVSGEEDGHLGPLV